MRNVAVCTRLLLVATGVFLCLSLTASLSGRPRELLAGQQTEQKQATKQQDASKKAGSKAERKRKRRRGGLRPEMFERPNRHEWQKPELVIKHMGLRPGQVIADIGAGSGYFSRRFAKVVGEKGIVYACDVAENMLRYIQEDCKKRGVDNIVTVLAATWSPMLPPCSVDFVFLCNTNHHIQNRVEYYRRLKKVFKPGGKLVIIDLFKHKKFGPPPEHKLAREVVLKEMKEAGYRLIEDNVELLPYQYYLVFEPICEQDKAK